MSVSDLSTRARSENEYYIATIAQPSTELMFRGWVPESFNINFRSNWEPIYGSLNDISSVTTKAAQTIGAVPNLKQATRLAWTGSDPIELQLTFLLDAYKHAYLDVQQPIENLLKMTLPERKSGILYSPGPTPLSDDNVIYLRIGKFFVLDSIVITDVDVTYHTISDIYGNYQAADVNVALRSHYTPDRGDVLSYFENGRLGINSLLNTDPKSAIYSAYSTLVAAGTGAPNTNNAAFLDRDSQ